MAATAPVQFAGMGKEWHNVGGCETRPCGADWIGLGMRWVGAKQPRECVPVELLSERRRQGLCLWPVQMSASVILSDQPPSVGSSMSAEEAVSDQFPAYATETAPVARRFVRALKEQDQVAISPLLVPDSEADWAFRIFGLGPLVFLSYLHLECDQFVLSRFGRRSDQQVAVELAWVTGEDEEGRATYDPRRVCTLTMRRHAGEWRVAHLNPTSMDAPVSVPQAQDLLRQVVAEGRGGNPIWFPLGVLTGAFQLKRLGRERLDEVEAILVEGMGISSFGVPEVVRAVRLWREFKQKAGPTYRRPEAYAAGVEYVMVLFGFYGDSQVEISERYGVSPASISAKWREMEDVLGLTQFDPRYSLYPDPGARLEARLKEMGKEPPPPIPLGTGRGARSYDMTVR